MCVCTAAHRSEVCPLDHNKPSARLGWPAGGMSTLWLHGLGDSSSEGGLCLNAKRTATSCKTFLTGLERFRSNEEFLGQRCELF